MPLSLDPWMMVLASDLRLLYASNSARRVACISSTEVKRQKLLQELASCFSLKGQLTAGAGFCHFKDA